MKLWKRFAYEFYDVRNELLWSGGTVGLSEMWPKNETNFRKKFWYK
ncbi:MAG: hypothetical protein CM15mV63_420 [uncultured marine virus]|nr:MAG: hypothetical protein CM15mV63_420 [uncultured marine virus]